MLRLSERLLGDDPDFRRFVILLAGATAVPMLLVPITQRFHPRADAVLALAGLLSFVGGPAHVSLTTWFYLDPIARPHFREHAVRYYLVPIALIVGATSMYFVWGEATPTRWLNFGFSAWLLWHYQRQNWGIHSFVSRVTSGEPATRLEETVFRLSIVGAFIAGVKTVGFGSGTVVSEWADVAYQIGRGISSVVPFVILVALLRTASLRAAPARLATLLGGAVFFLPVYVFPDFGSAFLTYALAHGLQYVVFMSYVAGRTATLRSSSASPVAPGAVSSRPGVPALLLCALTVGILLQMTGDVNLLKEINLLPLYGLSLGITMAHFVIDAGIWRLRDEFPRRYVGPAFPFLGKP